MRQKGLYITLRQKRFPIHPIPRLGISSYGERILGCPTYNFFSPHSYHVSSREVCYLLYRRAKQLRIPDLLKNHRHPRKRTRDKIAVAQSKAWKKRCVRAFAPL